MDPWSSSAGVVSTVLILPLSFLILVHRPGSIFQHKLFTFKWTRPAELVIFFFTYFSTASFASGANLVNQPLIKERQATKGAPNGNLLSPFRDPTF